MQVRDDIIYIENDEEHFFEVIDNHNGVVWTQYTKITVDGVTTHKHDVDGVRTVFTQPMVMQIASLDHSHRSARMNFSSNDFCSSCWLKYGNMRCICGGGDEERVKII